MSSSVSVGQSAVSADELIHKPFQCMYDGCGKRFSKSSNLTQHIRIHTGEMPFECKVCSRRFRQSGNLTKHLKSHENAHLRWNRSTTEKPFKCPFENCDKSFTAKSSLQNHIRVHTGELPYACPVKGCADRFHARTALHQHLKSKHNSSDQYLEAISTSSQYNDDNQSQRCVSTITRNSLGKSMNLSTLPHQINANSSIREDCVNNFVEFTSEWGGGTFLKQIGVDVDEVGVGYGPKDPKTSNSFPQFYRSLSKETPFFNSGFSGFGQISSNPMDDLLLHSVSLDLDVIDPHSSLDEVCGFIDDLTDPNGLLGFNMNEWINDSSLLLPIIKADPTANYKQLPSSNNNAAIPSTEKNEQIATLTNEEHPKNLRSGGNFSAQHHKFTTNQTHHKMPKYSNGFVENQQFLSSLCSDVDDIYQFKTDIAAKMSRYGDNSSDPASKRTKLS